MLDEGFVQTILSGGKMIQIHQEKDIAVIDVKTKIIFGIEEMQSGVWLAIKTGFIKIIFNMAEVQFCYAEEELTEYLAQENNVLTQLGGGIKIAEAWQIKGMRISRIQKACAVYDSVSQAKKNFKT